MKRILLFTIIALTSSCSPKKEETSRALPDQRPPDFVLETRYGGGMRDTSSVLHFSADSSFLKVHSQDTTIIRPITISSAELDTLYAILKRNKFDKIESTVDSTVLDAETYSVAVYWNKNQNSILISDGDRDPVKEEWFHQWQVINEYIVSFIN